jgi:hypothetical protein
MCTDSNDAAGVSSGAALSGILALLVAEREQREGGGSRRTELVLARAGLSDHQITALTGRDARHVRALIDDAAKVPRVAWGHSALYRAGAALPDQSSVSERSDR